MTPIYGEQLHAGVEYDLGSHVVTRDEIVEFAAQWDPQSFHVDDASAEAGAYRGIIASGIHTMAVFQRLAVDAVYGQWSVIAGRRLLDVAFLRPVRPDDRLDGTFTVDDVAHDGYGRTVVTATGLLSLDGRPAVRTVLEILVRTAPSANG